MAAVVTHIGRWCLDYRTSERKAVIARPGYRRSVVDPSMFPQNGRVVLVMLQDGRQVEGELHSMSGRYEIGGETFDAWEIEELEDVT